jgi:hypothetical protein
MEEKTLIDLVQDAMLSDDEDREEQSEYLARCYNEASVEAKNRIDTCFIALCGWSLDTLMKRQQGKE